MQRNTGRTTAKITAQHGLVYAKLIREYGAIVARRRFYEANMAAIEANRTLAEKNSLRLRGKKTAYVYSTADHDALEKGGGGLCAAYKFRTRWRKTRHCPCVPSARSACRVRAQFHPLKPVCGAATGARLPREHLCDRY